MVLYYPTGCRWTEAHYNCAEALELIEPYFEVLRDEYFAPRLPRVRRARLECNPKQHNTPRHFASAFDDGSLVRVGPEFPQLGQDRVTAILAHELGHIADFQYPGRFVLEGRHLRDFGRATSTMQQWRELRDRDTVEITADLIAEQVMQARIGYSGPCLLQSFRGGQPRPLGLR